MRDVVVVGGSNSLMGKGWSGKFLDLYGDGISFRNFSIGAATSLMGIYRMKRGDIPEGATVLWEYALNESNHLRAGQSCESLLHHLDWFMETARRRNIRVLPLQFWNRPELASEAPNDYRLALHDRLAAYGLRQIDARKLSGRFAAEAGVDVAALYLDDMHYGVDTGFLDGLVRLIADRLDDAAVPQAVPRLRDAELDLCRPDGPSGRFETSVFQADTYPLNGEGLSIAAQGNLLASFVIAGDEGGAVTVSADGERIGTYSLQAAGLKPQVRIFKHLVHWKSAGDLRPVRSSLSLSAVRLAARPIVQNMYKWNEASAQAARSDEYVCALIERDINSATCPNRPSLRWQDPWPPANAYGPALRVPQDLAGWLRAKRHSASAKSAISFSVSGWSRSPTSG
ncbi:hypothetical protein GIY56_17435 [Paracoccus sp. YIM 132242]|uniref:SGNH/GDSL hydrolase family protein n=1 Tax=Paracoccus lichenicola TaxID=2665644 RepID=A0A6L6HVN2_9RHOB|nr:hypothetical protein [Paracoccus lichenicola]MTE02075.1 hypothetical protein [Paracoccus lichenicola]